MNKSILTLLSLALIIFAGCNTKKTQKEIEAKLNELYSKHVGVYDLNLDSNIFSEDIVCKIKKLREMTELDIERIKNSEYPTDKPFMVEGCAFTSLLDGYSKYTIKNISIQENNAEVLIDFEYASTPVETWTDKVILAKDSCWKIENIIFDTKYNGSKGLKEKFDKLIANNTIDTIVSSVKDKTGKEIKMVYDNIKRIVTITLNKEKIVLKEQITGSGFRYADEHYELRGKGDKVKLSKDGKVIFTNLNEKWL